MNDHEDFEVIREIEDFTNFGDLNFLKNNLKKEK